MAENRFILFINAAESFQGILSANADSLYRANADMSTNLGIYPNLGLLQLMSSLKSRVGDINLGYLDGNIYGNKILSNIIEKLSPSTIALCFSIFTDNYKASLNMANLAKRLNPKIINVVGNDHFSALYQEVMNNQPNIDYGFCGNDVVEGFTSFMADFVKESTKELSSYIGLVYRDYTNGIIKRNMEDPAEYSRLGLVDYSLVDGLLPHQRHYLENQEKTYAFMRARNLKAQLIDIGRGCIKFAGERLSDVPINACDFCGIIPGTKAIVSPKAERAWEILKNAYDQGFNYFYITADELPLTMWPLLRDMSKSIPGWYKSLLEKDRPLFGYARAEAFATRPERIDTLVDVLGFDHFFIGFDGLSDISLKVMNKQPVGAQKSSLGLMEQNMKALDKVVCKGGMVTAGIVLTHLGITPDIMKENYENLKMIVEAHTNTFASLDFGPMCPIPGSHSFRYMKDPDFAESRAKKFGLRVNRPYLESIKSKYENADELDSRELIHDFVIGCCPDISPKILEEYMERTSDLTRKHRIVVGGPV